MHTRFRSRAISLISAIVVLLSCLFGFSIDAHGWFPYSAHTNDYGEYLDFLDEWQVDKSFVRYENIQSLGEFSSFYSDNVLLLGIQSPYDYSYNLIDKNGYALSLYFLRHGKKVEQGSLHDVSSDMRTISTSEYVEITRGPLHYRYYQGTLSNIVLLLGDVKVILIPQDETNISTYPTDGERTVTSRLLSRNYFTALFAYYELVWDIPLQPGETWLGRMQHLIWPPVILILLIAACITAIWFIRRIRRKKAAMFPTQWHNRRYD